MEDRIGIIDLGSNTFHILIVDIIDKNVFKNVYKERCFVGLAEEGLDNLSANAMDKGLKALTKFKAVLEEYNVGQFKVTGTAALRSANNRSFFINTVKERLGLDIEVIDGQREAELIFKGISLIYPMEGNHLIMDIGGGSVEFILVQNGQNIWSKSSNIGVGVLHSKFHKSDPISQEQIHELTSYLDNELEDLQVLIKENPIKSLVGASGSFEVVESMNGKPISTNRISNVSLDEFWQVSKQIIESTMEERIEMKGLPSTRIKLIVVAMILIEVVITKINPEKIMISPFALKEGILSELYA